MEINVTEITHTHICNHNCLKRGNSIYKLKPGYMLQYGCHFVTDWHAHPRVLENGFLPKSIAKHTDRWRLH